MPLKVLFIAEAVTLAHVSRPLVLAQALGGERHEVSFACGDRWRHFVESAGIRPYSIPTMAPEEFARRLAVGKPLFSFDRLIEYSKAELELFARISPDVVVGDFRVSLGISTAVAKIPYVALANAYWSPYSTLSVPVPDHPAVDLLGPRVARLAFPLLRPVILRWHIRNFNRLRRYHGLRPVASLQEMNTWGTWTLYLDIPRLAPTTGLPPTHQYLGPVLWEPDVVLPPWWPRMPTQAPIVYVTLGSSGNPRLWRPLLEACKGLPVVVAAATAGYDLGPVPQNVYAADYLPALKIIERAGLVVSNGGSPTGYQALSRGVPILGLPANADQYLMMESVAREGAGILIRSGTATARHVRTAIERLLTEKRYRQAAIALQTEMRHYQADQQFAVFIRNLPLQRHE